MSYITKYLYTVFTVAFLVIPHSLLAYEPETTHAGLSQELVDFYNTTHSRKLSSEEAELVISGSVDEDSPVLRVVNHFYDPVYGIGINDSRTALDWALGDIPENEYSWQKAISYYAEGDENKAFLALGRILHLIEDMSVPDHTRNDPHIGVGAKGLYTGESPYESWTDKNKNRQTMRGLHLRYLQGGERAKRFNTLKEHFDFLANYSNKNFFSQDTIDLVKYKTPNYINSDKRYVYWSDTIQHDFFKSLIIIRSIGGQDKYLIETNDDKSVLSSYFDRLSKQAILTGAGVIDLFFKEAELARSQFLAKQKQDHEVEVAKAIELHRQLSDAGFVTLIGRGFGFLVNDNFITPISNTVTVSRNGFTSGVNIIASVASNAGSMVVYTSRALAREAVDRASTIIASVIGGDRNIATSPTQAPIVVSKISEAIGTRASRTKMSESPNLLHTVATSTPAVVFEIMESPVLLKDDEDIAKEIFASATTSLVSSVLVASSTLLNDNDSLALAYIATPIAESTPLSGGGGGGGVPDVATVVVMEIATTTATSSPELLVAVTSTSTPITEAVLSLELASSVAINEIAWGGTPGNPEDEWIELYNKSSQDISLEGFTLYSKTDNSPYIKLSGTIPARGYFLIEAKNTGEADEASQSSVRDITADLWTSFGSRLSNTGENLVLSYTSTSIGGSATTTIDEIPFCFNWCGVPAGRTTERYSPNLPGNINSSWSANNAFIFNGLNASGTPIVGTPRSRNSLNYLINKGQDISSNLTLTRDDSPYIVNDITQRVSSGFTLNIEPGVVVKFRNSARLLVEGDITAIGTGDDPIVFTAFADDDYGGDMDRAVAVPTKGSWFGVELTAQSNTSRFENTIFRYGGNYGTGATFRKAMLYVTGTSPSITNSTFEYSKAYGVYIDSSNSDISNNIFRYNTGDSFSTGLYVNQGTPTVTGNRFSENNVGLSVNLSSGNFSDNIFSGEGTAMIVSGPPGTISGNNGDANHTINLVGPVSADSSTTTLVANPMPYYLSGTVVVPTNSTLDIKEGTVIKNSTLGSPSLLSVFGRLNIETSNNAGVVFSSNEATPRRGAWLGILMNPGSSSKIRGATIQEAQAGIKYNNSPINLEDVIFSTNTTGVQVINSTVEVATSTIFIDNGADKNPSNLW